MSKSKKISPFTELKFPVATVTINTLFSLIVLGGLIFFVYDVASVLSVYFEVGDSGKWQIISKFKTPIITTVIALLLFNILSVFVCLFCGKEIFLFIDRTIKQIDRFLVGDEHQVIDSRFSRQFSGLSRKLGQLQDETRSRRAEQLAISNDVQAISNYLNELLTEEDIQPPPLRLNNYPQLAEQLNELATKIYPLAIDKAQ